jgi:SynChlorMet cassette radical SAM/SPASM protein ScmE
MRVMATPRSVDIDITSRCNLRCTYCYHFSGAGDVDADLPTEEWLRFFAELRACAVMKVSLAGGEPFFRKDLFELIEGIVHNNMRFSILSNGTLITDQIAEFLSGTQRCDYVQVSLDGSKAEIHDACRGRGNFDRAVRGINSLQQHSVPVQVRATIHRHNVADLEEMARFLLEEIGLDNFSTNAASYMGLLRQNVAQVGLTVEDRILAMESFVRLNKRYENRINAQAGPLAEAKMWAEMENARDQGKKEMPGRGHLTACGCVMDTIAVRADGAIIPCTMLSHIKLGRVNKDDFKAIWQSHPEMQKMRRRRSIPLSDFEFCRGCEYINFCTGNCPGLAYTITGKVDHPSPDACLRRFLEEGGRLPLQ